MGPGLGLGALLLRCLRLLLRRCSGLRLSLLCHGALARLSLLLLLRTHARLLLLDRSLLRLLLLCGTLPCLLLALDLQVARALRRLRLLLLLYLALDGLLTVTLLRGGLLLRALLRGALLCDALCLLLGSPLARLLVGKLALRLLQRRSLLGLSLLDLPLLFQCLLLLGLGTLLGLRTALCLELRLALGGLPLCLGLARAVTAQPAGIQPRRGAGGGAGGA